MMNYRDIERFKAILTNMLKSGARFEVPSHGINGRVVGIGFKPYWTNPADTKIDKLELNIADSYGRITPFSFNYVIGYDVASYDGRRLEHSKRISLDIHVYASKAERDSDPWEKVRLNIIADNKEKKK